MEFKRAIFFCFMISFAFLRETHRETETDRETDRQTDRDRETESKWMLAERFNSFCSIMSGFPVRDTHRDTDRQTDRQTGQTDRQTDRK